MSAAAGTVAGTTAILLRAAHAGPALAVTVLSALLALSAGLSPGRAALVTAAVLAGRLSVGWSNDLRDRVRDAAVGRSDKPLATGALAVATVQRPAAPPSSRRSSCRSRAGRLQDSSTSGAWPRPGPTTSGSRRPCCRGCRTPCRSVVCLPSSTSPAGRAHRRWSWPAVPCSGSALTCSTSCPTSPTTPPRVCAVSRTGSEPAAAPCSRSRCSWRDRSCCWSRGSMGLASTVAGGVLVAVLAGLALLGRGRAPFYSAVGIALTDVVVLVVR